jgi:hypothetical protein
MNDLFLTGMNRRSRTAVEIRRKSLRRRARDGMHRVLGAVDALVAADGAQTDNAAVVASGSQIESRSTSSRLTSSARRS